MVRRTMSDGDGIKQGAVRPRVEMARDRGMALIIVLWVVASAALLVSSFNAIVRSHANVTTAELETAKWDAVLDAGLEMAAARLINENEDTHWPPDGNPHIFRFGGHNLSITIVDPNGLIDLNKLSPELLLNFLQHFASSESEALKVHDAILRVRRMGGEPSEQDSKTKKNIEAEAPDTSKDSRSGKPVSFAFIDKTQLRHVPGVSEKLYRKIEPFLTVYSRDGSLNPSTPPEVLSAVLDQEADDIKRLQENRRSNAPSPPPTSGTTFIISVVAANPNRKSRMGKEFVITFGLDDQAPYRLISWRSLMPSG